MEALFVGTLIVIALIVRLCCNVADAIRQARRTKAIQLTDVDRMDGLAFERYVSRLLEHQGYSTHVTKASGDFGVDIVATRWGERLAVQVKRSTGRISRRAVSDAVAGKLHYRCNNAVVVSNNYFSSGAIDHARRTGCVLVDRNELAKWMIAYQTGRSTDPVENMVNWLRPGSDEAKWEAALENAKDSLEMAGLILEGSKRGAKTCQKPFPRL